MTVLAGLVGNLVWFIVCKKKKEKKDLSSINEIQLYENGNNSRSGIFRVYSSTGFTGKILIWCMLR